MGFLKKIHFSKFKPTLLKHRWIILIFSLSIFLRFWHVPELFFFGLDEEYQSLLGWSIVKDFHIIWIGTSMADTGFYLGPGFVYFHSLLLYLSHGDPVVLGYMGALIGIVTTIVLYLTTKDIYSQKIGIIASILYGFSTYMNFADRRFWNPTLIPLVSILIVYSLIKSQKNELWIISLAFLLACTLHIHASLFVYFFIIPLILFVQFNNQKSVPSKKTIILAIVSFIIVTSPLIVFDLVHNFDNLKTPLRLLSRLGSNNSEITWIMSMKAFFDTLVQSFIFMESPAIFIIVSPIIIYFFWFLWKHKDNEANYVLFVTVITYFFIFVAYPGKVHPYYLLGLIPAFFIGSSVALSKITNKFLMILLAIFIGTNMYLFYLVTPSRYGIKSKKILIEHLVTAVGDESFSLSTTQSYRTNPGWRYLFQAYGKTPIQSDADQMFGWIYPDEINGSIKPTYTIFISTKHETLPQYSKEVYEAPYYGYIIKHNEK